MPENVQMQKDRPLEAPSLLQLSAEIVANNAESLLVFGKQVGVSGSCSLPSSSRSVESTKFPRVAGLRDQAAEQALSQHQTAVKGSTHPAAGKCIFP